MPRYTRRQLIAYYRAAIARRHRDRADRLHDLRWAFSGHDITRLIDTLRGEDTTD